MRCCPVTTTRDFTDEPRQYLPPSLSSPPPCLRTAKRRNARHPVRRTCPSLFVRQFVVLVLLFAFPSNRLCDIRDVAQAMASSTTVPTTATRSTCELISKCSCGNSRLHLHLPTTATTTPTTTSTPESGAVDTIAATALDCHCPKCRKFHAAAFVSYLSVPESQVRFVNGFKEQNGPQPFDVARQDMQSYRDTCKELGLVERWICPHCASKLATTIVGDGTGATTDSTSPDGTTTSTNNVFVNMGPLMDKTIPKAYAKAWKKHRAQWQLATQATWTFAKPFEPTDEEGDEDAEEDDDEDEEDDDDEGDGSSSSSSSLTSEGASESSTSTTTSFFDVLSGNVPGGNDAAEDKDPTKTIMEPYIPKPLSLSGGCACGATRYTISDPSSYATELQHCYCRLCRQLSGGPFQTWVPISKDTLTWTTKYAKDATGSMIKDTSSGTTSRHDEPPLVRTTEHGQRHICPCCGTVLTIVYDDQYDTVWPAAGTIDDVCFPSTRQQTCHMLYRVVHICCRYKQVWYRIPKDNLPRISEAG